jgi:uncharacterized protein YqgC (DUF456 family)
MIEVLALLLLLICCLAGLVLIPLGLPGLWVMLIGLIGYGALTDFRTVGIGTMAIALALCFVGEVVESWVGFKYARKYGGSGRAGWGAVIGGLVGAFAGIPIPIIGSIIGSFLGSFAGAAIFEFTKSPERAAGAGWGALVGRVIATALKTALGFIIALLGLIAVLR